MDEFSISHDPKEYVEKYNLNIVNKLNINPHSGHIINTYDALILDYNGLIYLFDNHENVNVYYYICEVTNKVTGICLATGNASISIQHNTHENSIELYEEIKILLKKWKHIIRNRHIKQHLMVLNKFSKLQNLPHELEKHISEYLNKLFHS